MIVRTGTAPPSTCMVPAQPATGGNWHSKTKQLIDLAVLAMACDLTRVVTIQYSDSWGVNYTDYQLGAGTEAVGKWSDHFILTSSTTPIGRRISTAWRAPKRTASLMHASCKRRASRCAGSRIS
jgi:hypothetical protein